MTKRRGLAGRGRSGARPAFAARSAAANRPSSPPPALGRDPWAWASALAVLPLLLRSLGAPLGEPVAEDFDFLRRMLLEQRWTLLDGGGSLAFWRPLAHQVYYLVLGPLILGSPGVVAAIHAVLLALAGLLLYRTLRPAWPGHVAAAAASFPLLAESTRTLLSWPSHFVDLGLFLFSVLALHEAARRRLPTALASLLAALLCKEVAIVTGLLLPWLPGPAGRRERTRQALASGALMAGWALAYLVIRRHAGLALPHHLEGAGLLGAAPLPVRFHWAWWNSARAIFDLWLVPGPRDLAVAVALASLGLLGALALAVSGRARARLARAWPWLAWGAGWFVLASVTLMAIHPLWAPNRSQFGSVGLGIALTILLDAAHPALLAALVGLRLILLGVSPGPPAAISRLPAPRGAFMDFERLVRLQRLARAVHTELRARHPRLPPGAHVSQHHFPHMTSYALGGDRALQIWYRDTTLRWVTWEAVEGSPDSSLVAAVQYQEVLDRPIVLIPGDAVRAMARASRLLAEGRPGVALAEFDLAERLGPDGRAPVFRSVVAGRRALCLAWLQRTAEAEAQARVSLALWSENPDGHVVLALVWADAGRLTEAGAAVDRALAFDPGNRRAQELRDLLRAELLRAPGAPAVPGR